MAERIEFTFEIVGGPRDGMTGRYDGQLADGQSIKDALGMIGRSRLLFEDHNYALIDFDKFKMHATIMY